jgi:oxygen-independent coproporphyrinogen-3 oxidase
MKTKNIGLYIHIPFCKRKCKYCDFVSYSNIDNRIQKYIFYLKKEIEDIGISNSNAYKMGEDSLINIKTIYIGGGTPSYIDSKYIKEILEKVRENYKVSEDVEITLEMNPGTIDESKLQDYKEAGINRISIGLQSTNNETLKRIGRIHTYEEFLEAFLLARKVGFENINVDLMLALPKQTIGELEEGLEKVIELNPEHISIYSLILEENTALYNEVNDGKYIMPSDEEERKMYWKTKRKLEKAGYIHYEISNFAKKGFESKHNLACWNQEEYIGVGAAAHSYTNNVRYSNIDDIEKYINNFEIGKDIDNLIFHEKQNHESKIKEYMILGLRKIEGIDIDKFKNKFFGNPLYIFRKELDKLIKEDLVEIDGNYIKLTSKGLDLANIVWEEFI